MYTRSTLCRIHCDALCTPITHTVVINTNHILLQCTCKWSLFAQVPHHQFQELALDQKVAFHLQNDMQCVPLKLRR